MEIIMGRPVLSYLKDQLDHAKLLDEVILAVPDTPGNADLSAYGVELGWKVFEGSETDVLGRFYHAAAACGAEKHWGIVRLTGDDILPDPSLIDAVANLFRSFGTQYDYIATDRAGRLPYGAGIEIFSFAALTRAYLEATESHAREHVVPYIKWNPELFRILELHSHEDLSDTISLSIDTPEDLKRNEALLRLLTQSGPPPFHICDVLAAAKALSGQVESARE
jgi:spore coat polysaccharide biosynthesis protein SpsF (cytidylyltransferase family)